MFPPGSAPARRLGPGSSLSAPPSKKQSCGAHNSGGLTLILNGTRWETSELACSRVCRKICSRHLTKFHPPEATTEMRRRDLLKGALLLPALAGAGVPTRFGQGCDLNFGPAAAERLNQGPFEIDQDQGWQTVQFTTPSERPIRNPGLGLVGYSGEAGGPGNTRTARGEDLEPAVRGCSLHSLRLAQRAISPGTARSRPGLGTDDGRGQAQGASRRVSNSVIEHFLSTG